MAKLHVGDAMLTRKLSQKIMLRDELQRHECLTEPTAPHLVMGEGTNELVMIQAARL